MSTGDVVNLVYSLKGDATGIAVKKNTTVYLVTGDGGIYTKHITTGALTKTATIVKEKLTCIATNETLNYIGTASGKIFKQTISGGAVTATPIANFKGTSIVGLAYDATATLLYVLTNKGTVHTVDE